MNINQKIVKELTKGKIKNSADLDFFKRKMAKKYKINCLSNIELLKVYHEAVKKRIVKKSIFFENLLKTRPVRSLSGIVNVSVLTKPYPCPGKCLYCPQEKGIPKSYLSGEPAVERAKKLKYSPYWQTRKRIEALKQEGHPTDKIELRIIGGTWSYYPKKYQEWFVKRCFDACNEKQGKNLKTTQGLNERAKNRIIGLSVETRPDFINESEIKQLRKLGVTKVELGIQSVNDGVLEINQRGHDIKEAIKATKLLKNAGFKVSFQAMLNLAGSDCKMDLNSFKEIFGSPDFKPDSLKIYPCVILKEAGLFQWYLKGKYKPYSEETLIKIIKEIKREIPEFIRIERIIRDIPSTRIVSEGNPKILNLRQIIAGEMKKEGWRCQCIRCREIKGNYDPKERVYLFRKDYLASEGKEIFLTFENKNRSKLYSLLRLRIPPQYSEYCDTRCRNIFPILKNSAIIRELHTFGQVHPIQKIKNKGGRVSFVSSQHKGLGKKLIKTAEKIVKKEFRLNKIVAISGVGARDYYRKLGYKLKDTYMVKKI